MAKVKALERKVERLTPKELAGFNNFIKRSFRDVADQDYILARMAFRYELDAQFIWLAHQAVEKYLKALLLFSELSTIKFSHDLLAALDAVEAIPDIPFEFTPAVRDLVKYLDKCASRYFEYPYYVTGDKLLALDETVWYLRRYCDFVRGSTTTSSGDKVDRLEFEILRRQKDIYKKHPNKFHLPGGFLENVRDTRQRSELRQFLLWNNTFFGRRRTTTWKLERAGSSNPPLFLYPDVFDHLNGLVQFSKKFKKRFSASKRLR